MEPGAAVRDAVAAADFGSVIKLCRQERGLTQRQLGELCGYSQTAVSRLERRGPLGTYDLHMLRRIADVLEIPPRLLGLAEPEVPSVPVNRRQFLVGLTTTLATTISQLDAAATAAGNETQRGSVLQLLGRAHEAMGAMAFDQLRFNEAAEHFHSAYEVGTELGDADMTATALVQLGDVARRQGRYPTALRLLSSTERHASASSALTQVLLYKTTARAHAEMGDRPLFERAIEGLELARSYGSARHVSRVQRMHDRLLRTIPRTDPRLAELHDALAA